MIYAFVNMLSSLGSLATIIYGAVNIDTYGHKVWIIGLVYFFAFPIAHEILLNIKGFLFRNTLRQHNCDHL